MSEYKGSERRKGVKDRRVAKQDRRNDDRVAELGIAPDGTIQGAFIWRF